MYGASSCCGPSAEVYSKGGLTETTNRTRRLTPRSDIWEAADKLVVRIYMPGIELGEVEVDVENEVLSVLGKAKQFEGEGLKPIHQETQLGDYFRSFKLTDEINVDGIDASMKDGLLTLTLPKSERVKPRKISIKTN